MGQLEDRYILLAIIVRNFSKVVELKMKEKDFWYFEILASFDSERFRSLTQ